jgi:U3 small nucleolar RNA-associated protein 14
MQFRISKLFIGNVISLQIDRSVAYDQTSEVFNKWDSIVTKNRQVGYYLFDTNYDLFN